jgi:hypothetical protein
MGREQVHHADPLDIDLDKLGFTDDVCRKHIHSLSRKTTIIDTALTSGSAKEKDSLP